MTTDSPEFIFSRSFGASRNVVWKAWTDAEQLKHWFGPKGCPIFYCKLDLRPGGIFLYGMKTPDGQDMWGKWVFKEIAASRQLVFSVLFSDPLGGVTRHPWNANWPLETSSVIRFEEEGDKTKVTVQGAPINARPSEIKIFAEGMESMQQGWSATMDQLAAFLQTKV